MSMGTNRLTVTGKCNSVLRIMFFTLFCLLTKVPISRAHEDAGKSTADSWPMFRGDALLTGVSPKSLPDDLRVLWKFTREEAFTAAAAIGENIVFVGCDDEHLYALD